MATVTYQQCTPLQHQLDNLLHDYREWDEMPCNRRGNTHEHDIERERIEALIRRLRAAIAADPKVYRCTKTACYNDRNGRECWTTIHQDGRKSYEWPSKEVAEANSRLTLEEATKSPNHQHIASFC